MSQHRVSEHNSNDLEANTGSASMPQPDITRTEDKLSEGGTMKQPTAEQCNENAQVDLPREYDPDVWAAYAYWYPQMGGYTSKSIFIVNKTDPDDCFEAYIWHDGEFPFNEEDGNPAHLHHCDPVQFIEYGKFVDSKRHASGSDLVKGDSDAK